MFAIVFLPLIAWGIDNHEFFERLSAAEWEYVGVQERSPGPQPDGSYALTMSSPTSPGGETFILYKQRRPEVAAAAENQTPGQERAVADAAE